MMIWMDAFERHESEKERRLRQYPVCDCCGERIQTEFRWHINDEYYCEECVRGIFVEYNEPEEGVVYD